MKRKGKLPFDPKRFLARVGKGKTVSKYRRDQIVFSQGQVADAVFYIQQGKVKLTVVSEQGKEAVVAILWKSTENSERSIRSAWVGWRRRIATSASRIARSSSSSVVISVRLMSG